MPNHITNMLTINGTDEQVKEVLEFMKSDPKLPEDEQREFDFNKLLPRPEELDITAGSSSYSPTSYFGTPDEFVTPADAKMEMMNQEIPDSRRNYLQSCLNFAKYGCSTWYDWNCTFWGTKWNAYDIEITAPIVKFDTAWSCPVPIFEALAKKFPTIPFEVKYADEDTGCNVGRLKFTGEDLETEILENCSNEAYELAFEIKGGSEYYKLVDGKYEYDESVED